MKIDHIAIYTKHLDRTLSFYQDVFGGTIQRIDDPKEPVIFTFEGGESNIVIFQGEKKNDFFMCE